MLIDGRAEGIISKVLAILIVQNYEGFLSSIQTLQSTKDNHSQEADRVDNLLLGLPLILWKSHPLANDFAARLVVFFHVRGSLFSGRRPVRT